MVVLLEFLDVENFFDDEFIFVLNKFVLYDFFLGDLLVWKIVVNFVNYIEGIGFFIVFYVFKEGGIVVLLVFIIILIILLYVGKILIECFYDEDKKGNKCCVRLDFKELGDVFLFKYGGYIVFCVI